jgi:hypothetical protein
MPVGTWYDLTGAMPDIDSPPSAVGSPMVLPAGGPIGIGGGYSAYQALTFTNNPAQPQIFTLTITPNGATGAQGYFVYNGDTVYSGLLGQVGITTNLSSAFPTAAQVQAALVAAYQPWSGNVTVTGSVGGPYTITFNSLCATKSIGGLLQYFNATTTGGTPTNTITVTQQGSCGAFDATIFNPNVNNRVDGILMYSQLIDGVGGDNVDLAGDIGQAASGVPAWSHGYFNLDTTNNPEKAVIGAWGASVPARFTVVQGTWGTLPGLVVILQ